MADDIKVNASADVSAPSVATDDITGKHYQKIKTGWGADGTWNEVDDVDSKRFPVIVKHPSLTMTHTHPTVTTTTGVVLAANSNRKYALLINDGEVDIYVKFTSAAVAHQGIRINAFGGSYEMSPNHGNLSTVVINGITEAESAVLLVTEGA